jgi:hypothetical protein
MRSLGATAPFRPSTDAGTTVGKRETAAVAAALFLRNDLLVSLFFVIFLS